MKLNELADNKGARRSRMRVGRGIGSGKGKTSGSGHKGQKARSGVAINGFEGGQMPLYMRLPKRGFRPYARKTYAVLNTGALQKAVDAGKLDPKKDVTDDVLVSAGLIGSLKLGVKVLAKGDLTAKLNLKVTTISKAAQTMIEKSGGSVSVSLNK